MKWAELIAQKLAVISQAADAALTTIKTLITPVSNAVGYGAVGDGITNDHAAIQSAINDAISNGSRVYIPAGRYYIGSNTLEFPNTMPKGFYFECHPQAEFIYDGSGATVRIDSCFLANIKLGRLIYSGSSTTAIGLHLNPALPGPNTNTEIVISKISANEIWNFPYPIKIDCTSGHIAQNDLNFGHVCSGMDNSIGVIVDGVDPHIFQGNKIFFRYLIGGGWINWTGIKCGGSTWNTPLYMNLNIWEFGAIDALSKAGCIGIVSYQTEDVFIGHISGVVNGVKFEGSSDKNILIGIISSSGGKVVHNTTGVLNRIIEGGYDQLNTIQWGKTGNLTSFMDTSGFITYRRSDGSPVPIFKVANQSNTAYVGGMYNDGTGLFSNILFGAENSNLKIISGSGSPEGVVAGAIGSLYLRSNGGAGTTLYVKESGGAFSTTGWVAK